MRQILEPNRRWTLALALIVGCGGGAESDSGDDMGPAGGKADDADPATFACQNVSGIALEQLVDIDDPIATFLIKRGEGCPEDYGAMIAKLRAVDPDGCEEGADVTTRVVSDDARIDDNPSNYRTVSSRACGSRQPHEMFWTLLGVRADEALAGRRFVEMEALDRNTGLYNYYVFNGNRFTFQGTSQQAVDGEISCGGCHRGGGVLMKELDRPWLHWESEGFEMPGVDEMFESHRVLFGVRGEGLELEELIRVGNDAVIGARIRHQREPATGSLRELLEPLFCHQQINIDTAGKEPGMAVTELPADMLIDPHFGVERSVRIDPAVYDAAIVAANARVPNNPGVTDTAFKFAFAERAGIDNAYVQALITEGIVDADFVTDVLSVDFTQPLFSDDRCQLLDFVPVFGEPMVPEPDMGGTDTGGTDTGGTDTGTGGEGGVGDPGDDVGTCCTPAVDSPSCSNEEIQACVCAVDSFCCMQTWDATCVSEVNELMCGSCPDAGGGAPPPPSSGVPIAEATPDAIRNAFIAALAASDPGPASAAGRLLASLQDPDDEAAHRERVDAFLQACRDRPGEAMLADVLRYTEFARQRLRATPLIEHQEQMFQVDNPTAAGQRLGPATCALD